MVIAQRDTNIFHVLAVYLGFHMLLDGLHILVGPTLLKHVLFIWESYFDDLIENCIDYCRIGQDIWRVRASIFCWDVVEVHLFAQVMRQFRHITHFVTGNPTQCPQGQQEYAPNSTTYETMASGSYFFWFN
ncbi:hypothetical protein H5410_030235 [Solanum commersonii]|uniref:Uncharacterized protein n=1 Tax=Solanum commersonii TaxID=4109 RepID=A0A9J5YF26_SOLCO|nr:hypothetical protein H5410_030235 [Solanum commersonii]